MANVPKNGMQLIAFGLLALAIFEALSGDGWVVWLILSFLAFAFSKKAGEVTGGESDG